MATEYTQTVPTTPTAPSTTSKFDLDIMKNLLREIVVEDIYPEPTLQMELNSAKSFFTGDSIVRTDTLLSNLKFGQKIRLNIEKDANPFSLFQKEAISYESVDACHDQIVLDCTMPCINTLPEFEYLTFCFDTEYAWGVRACDKNQDFWDAEFFTRQYAKSKQAAQFGREVDLWNKVIDGLIASPATTVDVKLAELHPTHYWDNLGSVTAVARTVVPMAYYYMINSFAGINPTVFITSEFATELIKSVETPYGNLNLTLQRVNTFQDWDLPGFVISDAVKTIFGGAMNVVVMKRSPWLTTGSTGSFTSEYPLWSDDATKQYVAILDPRVGFQFEKEGYYLEIKPYDCDKLDRGIQESVYVGSGITFPQYGLILEFDQFTTTPAVGENSGLATALNSVNATLNSIATNTGSSNDKLDSINENITTQGEAIVDAIEGESE